MHSPLIYDCALLKENHFVAGEQQKGRPVSWVKVFRIIPEFRILRQTFHRMLNSADDISFSDLVSVYLKVIEHLTWNY